MPLLLFLLFPCLARCFAIPDTKIDGGKAVQLRVSQEKGARGFNFIPEIIEYSTRICHHDASPAIDSAYQIRRRMSSSLRFLALTVFMRNGSDFPMRYKKLAKWCSCDLTDLGHFH